MNVLNELQETVSRVVDRVGPAVVGLGRGWGRGSGVVIGEGQVLTNAHVLRGDAVTVTFHDGRRAEAQVLGADADADLAVLAVDTGAVVPVDWSDAAAEVRLGTAVVALANPGGRGLRATLGFVSQAGGSARGRRGRRLPAAIEHTAPLPRGSSGGPLVDQEGRLLGVNAVRVDGGLILAFTADVALRERVDGLARGEAPARPRLGATVAPPRAARRLRSAVGLPERDGLLVRDVQEGGAAERAGIRQGDLIVSAGERAIESIDALHEALDAGGIDGVITLRVVRGTDERDVAVNLSPTPQVV